MEDVILPLVTTVFLHTFIFAQGYLRNDDVTTHMSGITINEISAWSNPVDYNADGVVEGGDKDEFIELVNSSSSAININNWTIATAKEDDMDLFTFPDTSILPGKALVFFCRRPLDISNFNPGPGNMAFSAGNNTFRLANHNPDAVGLKNTKNLYITVHWEEGVVNSGFLSSNPTPVGTDVELDSNWYEGVSQARNPDYTGNWEHHPIIYGKVNWSNNDTTVILKNPTASPGRFFGQDITLPVELVNINAVAGQNFIMLKWETASEINNHGFVIERSMDSLNYAVISSFRDNSELIGQGNNSFGNCYSYEDIEIDPGNIYWYRLSDIDYNGFKTMYDPIRAHALPPDVVPGEFVLYQNYPNPFNPSTIIRFFVPELNNVNSNLNLVVYDTNGKKIKDLYSGPLPPGSHEIEWNGLNDQNRQVTSGTYFYNLSMGNINISKKMTINR